MYTKSKYSGVELGDTECIRSPSSPELSWGIENAYEVQVRTSAMLCVDAVSIPKFRNALVTRLTIEKGDCHEPERSKQLQYKMRLNPMMRNYISYTGLFEKIVGVITNCHKYYT